MIIIERQKKITLQINQIATRERQNVEMETNETVYELDIDPATVCRICLSQSGPLLNLFSNSIVDGYVVRLPQVLSYTLDITVSLT